MAAIDRPSSAVMIAQAAHCGIGCGNRSRLSGPL